MSAATKSTKKPKKKGSGTQPQKGKQCWTAALAAAAVNGHASSAYLEWAAYLRKRKQPVSVAKLWGDPAGGQLLWAVPASILDEVQRIDVNDSLPVAEWLANASQKSNTAALALETLAACHALPQLAGSLAPKAWHDLLDFCIHMARDAAVGGPAENPWVAQLTICELPLTLAYLLPEIDDCVELALPASERLSHSITELLDGQGLITANQLEWLPVLAACWTRCLLILSALKGLKASKDARLEFEWCIRNVLRLTSESGRFPFTKEQDRCPRKGMIEMINTAVKLTGDAEDKALVKMIFGRKKVAAARLPDEPAVNSEWAGLAVLQPEWSPVQPRLTVDYSGLKLRVELSNRGETVFSTLWDADVLVDRERLCVADDDWETTCWFSDFDVDFLELERELTLGWRIQRQFLLARQDLFLYTADLLLGPPDRVSNIEYRLPIPCYPGVTLTGNPDTRDCFLRGRRKLGLVLPLALPEWRTDPRHGELQTRDGAIELQQTAQGTALCSPLFFDLHPKRMQKPLTWRQLTVAEQLQIVPRDTAVGYRIQVGPEQWMIYRSLAAKGNRTLLGQNLSSEFLFGRFLHDGDVESLIEIE